MASGRRVTGVKVNLDDDERDDTFLATDGAGAIRVLVTWVVWELHSNLVTAYGAAAGVANGVEPVIGILVPLDELPPRVLKALLEEATR
jgi:hypothetical protein